MVTDKKNTPAQVVYLLMITVFLGNYFVREVKGQDRVEKVSLPSKGRDSADAVDSG